MSEIDIFEGNTGSTALSPPPGTSIFSPLAICVFGVDSCRFDYINWEMSEKLKRSKKLYKIWAKLLFFSAVVFSWVANASAETCSANSVAMVQESYIAYYGRPADPGGLDYWACRLDSVGGDMNSIIQAFGASSEFNTRFGALSNDQLLDNVYQQMLSRSPDPSGKDFYLAKLNSGEMTLQTITINILNGISGGIDADTFSNKYTVANYFSDQLRSTNASYGNIEDARLILSDVDGAMSSKSSAMSACDSLIATLLPAVQPPATITVPANDADGSYTVSWTASTTAGVSYTLQEATDSAFTTGLRTAYSGADLSASITSGVTGTTYYYRAMATKSGSANSGWLSGGNGCAIDSVMSVAGSWLYSENMAVYLVFTDNSFTFSGTTCSQNGTYVLKPGAITMVSAGDCLTKPNHVETTYNLGIVDNNLVLSGEQPNRPGEMLLTFNPALPGTWDVVEFPIRFEFYSDGTWASIGLLREDGGHGTYTLSRNSVHLDGIGNYMQETITADASINGNSMFMTLSSPGDPTYTFTANKR